MMIKFKWYPATFIVVISPEGGERVMKKYETIFILNPESTEEDVNLSIDKVKSIIESHKGTVDNVDVWGKKKLAYEVNKKNEGHFILMHFTSCESLPKELDRNLKIMDNVIRHIIVNKN